MLNIPGLFFYLTFRRAFVPTLARLHGRPSGFSWQVFSPQFSSFGRCEGRLGLRCRKDQRNHYWGLRSSQCQEWNRKRRRARRRFGRWKGLNKLYLGNLFVCVICRHCWELSGTVQGRGECITFMLLLGVGIACQHAWSSGKMGARTK